MGFCASHSEDEYLEALGLVVWSIGGFFWIKELMGRKSVQFEESYSFYAPLSKAIGHWIIHAATSVILLAWQKFFSVLAELKSSDLFIQLELWSSEMYSNQTARDFED